MARDFFAELDNLTRNIEDMDSTLLAIAGRLVSEMKADAPVDIGNLRDSIQATVENNTLSFQMLVYGLFQNYGVAGTEGDSRFGVVDEVPAGVLPPPLRGSKYQYKERAYGIPAQRFLDIEYLATQIQQEIVERIEL